MWSPVISLLLLVHVITGDVITAMIIGDVITAISTCDH